MSKTKTVPLKDKSKFTQSRGILDYYGMAGTLKSGANVFVYDSKGTPLKAQTMWKGAKKLSVLVGKKVTAEKGTLDNGKPKPLGGYLFTVVDENQSS